MSTAAFRTNGKSQPKYLQLSEKLKQDIQDGVYQRGSQLPAARELTTLLGVSYLTVSNVLQALEKDGYVKRLHGKGTFVTEPQAMPSSETRKVGYLMDVGSSFFVKLFSAISDKLNGSPVYNVPLHKAFGSNIPVDQAEQWLDEAMRNHYNSLVVYGDRHFPYRRLSDYLPEIEQLNIIVFDSCETRFSKANRILADVEQAGYLAARRFLDHGHRKLTVLGLQLLDDMYRRRYGISDSDYGKLVLDGIERAYAGAGCDFFSQVRVIAGPVGGPGNADSRFDRELRECLEGGCTAYFTLGDYRALPVYAMSRKLGIEVGKDIAVLGFLNDTNICELLAPRLSSISVNETEIGRLTAQAVKENWKCRTIKVQPYLVERESDGGGARCQEGGQGENSKHEVRDKR